MSRIGNTPLPVPDNVDVKLTTDALEISGPKGTLSQAIPRGISAELKDGVLTFSRKSDEKAERAAHGLIRSLAANMVQGVTEGYEKKLEVNGVGFKVDIQGQKINLALGYSHPVLYTAPDDINVSADGNVITVSGIDKQRVGQTAAEIRELRKPEPYKGKGIKYIDEYIIRKAGKSAAAGPAA